MRQLHNPQEGSGSNKHVPELANVNMSSRSFGCDGSYTDRDIRLVVNDITKFRLDSTAVNSMTMQSLPDAVGHRHVINVSANQNVDRGNHSLLGQLPYVKL
jgi:hypothetical protein